MVHTTMPTSPAGAMLEMMQSARTECKGSYQEGRGISLDSLVPPKLEPQGPLERSPAIPWRPGDSESLGGALSALYLAGGVCNLFFVYSQWCFIIRIHQP